MSKLNLTWLSLCLALSLGCQKQPAETRAEPLAKQAPQALLRYHFLGGKAVAESADSAKLKEVWHLPASQVLRQDGLQKLALAARELLVGTVPTNKTGATVLRPLLDELLSAESIAEVRGAGGKATEWALAFAVGADKTNIWHKHLQQALVEAGGGAPNQIQIEGLSGWEIKNPGKARLVRVVHQGDWMVLGAGQAPLSAHADMVGALKKNGRPAPKLESDWLTGEVDLARWTNGPVLPHWTQGPPGRWPKAFLNINSKENYIRTRMRLEYDQAVSWLTPSWSIPVSLVRDPLVSFTAGRGIANWLNKIDFIKKLQLQTLPDQLFVWAQGDVQQGFQTFAALPTSSPSNLIQTIARRLPAALNTNLVQRLGGDILWASNRTELRWQGLPFVAPYLRSAGTPEGNYLLAGLFTTPTGTNAPAELFDQLKGRTNLLYYDWEITHARLFGNAAPA